MLFRISVRPSSSILHVTTKLRNHCRVTLFLSDGKAYDKDGNLCVSVTSGDFLLRINTVTYKFANIAISCHEAKISLVYSPAYSYRVTFLAKTKEYP